MKIELDLSIARSLLPSMKDKAQNLETQIDGMSGELNDLLAAIALIENGQELKSQTVLGEPRKRSPKGQSRKLIVDFLKSLPDEAGMAAGEIAKKTGLKYNSVYRTLSKSNGKFVKDGDKWKIKK